jgi:hypothetical protein
MRPLTDHERALLQKLASSGRPTELDGDDLILGHTLEPHGLVLFVRNSASAVITPKGRHALAAIDILMKPVSPKKPPRLLGLARPNPMPCTAPIQAAQLLNEASDASVAPATMPAIVVVDVLTMCLLAASLD